MEEAQPHRVRIEFSLVDEASISWANYFMLQYGPEDGFVLSVCQLRPPVIVTDDQDVRRAALENLVVKARPVVRVAVGRAKLEALARLIDRQLERFPVSNDRVEDENSQIDEQVLIDLTGTADIFSFRSGRTPTQAALGLRVGNGSSGVIHWYWTGPDQGDATHIEVFDWQPSPAATVPPGLDVHLGAETYSLVEVPQRALEPEAVRNDFRAVEMAWLAERAAELARLYPGEWVAVDGEQLVGHGSDLSEVLEHARAAGHPDPLVSGLPDEPLARFY